MTDTPPTGWRVLAVPSNWDPADPHQLNIRQVTKDFVTTPGQFFMTIQTPDMIGKQEPTAIIVSFRATERDGVTLTRIAGLGAQWENYLGEVVQGFPSAGWVKYAKGLIVDFLLTAEKREAAGGPISELPRRQFDLAEQPAYSVEAGVQRRRKITPEHLQEVAKIYTAAQASADAPTRAVQIHFAVSHSTAAKWVGKAREMGLLPPHEYDE